MDGRQVVTFMIQRAKGSSEVTAYEAGWKELKKLEKENPKVHFSEVFNTSIIPRRNTARRWKA